MSEQTQSLAEKLWYLEGFVDSSRQIWRTVIKPLPLRIGRRPDMDLNLRSPSVSQEHAQIFARDGSLWIRDLGSTNGTFVNRERVRGEAPLNEGDILHLAELEFRLAVYRVSDESLTTRATILSGTDLASHLSSKENELGSMLRQRAFQSLFQPVVDLGEGQVLGYEVLSRGDLQGFETAPTELFFIAERHGLEAELSQAFRLKGIEEAARLPDSPLVFVNTHPVEIQRPEELARSLRRLPLDGAGFHLVLEIHEAAVTDIAAMKVLRAELSELGIRLAYDDFGTGQARLLDLVEVPPHYLKFDIGLVRDMHLASMQKARMVRALVQMAESLGIIPIAEGVDSPEEERACRELGFRYGQGYYLGLPAPIPENLEPGSLAANAPTARPPEG